MKTKNTLLILLMFMLLAACQKNVDYPIEPKITYEGFAYLINADTTLTGDGVLSIGYTDGDGDLGLDDSDTIYPFGPNDPHYYNIIIEYLKWNGTEFVATPLTNWNEQTQSYDTISFNARFKRLIDGDQPKPISGTIEYKMTLLNPLSPNDSIKLRAKIIDRALHESNTIETEIIHF